MPTRLVILGRPITSKNSSVIIMLGKAGAKRPVPIPSKQARDYFKLAIPQLQAQWTWEPIAIPVNLCARVYRERAWGDLGNYLAAICDILQKAAVVENDKWILGFDGSRLDKDAENPRVEIVISRLEDGGI